jgi:hypothetical protein
MIQFRRGQRDTVTGGQQQGQGFDVKTPLIGGHVLPQGTGQKGDQFGFVEMVWMTPMAQANRTGLRGLYTGAFYPNPEITGLMEFGGCFREPCTMQDFHGGK